MKFTFIQKMIFNYYFKSLFFLTNIALKIFGFKMLWPSNKKLLNYLSPLPSPNIILTELEALTLYKVASNLSGSFDAVEIGTWRGGSALIIASAIRDSNKKIKLHCIDSFSSDRDPVSRKYMMADVKRLNIKSLKENYFYCLNLFKQFKLNNLIKIHIGYSQKIGLSWNKKIELLFIDGDHRYQSVLNDINIWSNKLIKNGIVGIHDCKNTGSSLSGLPGPTKVAMMLKRMTKKWKFICQADSLMFFQKIS